MPFSLNQTTTDENQTPVDGLHFNGDMPAKRNIIRVDLIQNFHCRPHSIRHAYVQMGDNLRFVLPLTPGRTGNRADRRRCRCCEWRTRQPEFRFVNYEFLFSFFFFYSISVAMMRAENVAVQPLVRVEKSDLYAPDSNSTGRGFEMADKLAEKLWTIVTSYTTKLLLIGLIRETSDDEKEAKKCNSFDDAYTFRECRDETECRRIIYIYVDCENTSLLSFVWKCD